MYSSGILEILDMDLPGSTSTRWGKYLHSLPDVWQCDFILLIDSFDALILEPEEKLIEIVTAMEQTLGPLDGPGTSCGTELAVESGKIPGNVTVTVMWWWWPVINGVFSFAFAVLLVSFGRSLKTICRWDMPGYAQRTCSTQTDQKTIQLRYPEVDRRSAGSIAGWSMQKQMKDTLASKMESILQTWEWKIHSGSRKI